MTTSPRWLSISDYSRVYGIDRKTTYKLLKAGYLEAYRVKTLIRIKDQPPTKALCDTEVSTGMSVPASPNKGILASSL